MSVLMSRGNVAFTQDEDKRKRVEILRKKLEEQQRVVDEIRGVLSTTVSPLATHGIVRPTSPAAAYQLLTSNRSSIPAERSGLSPGGNHEAASGALSPQTIAGRPGMANARASARITPQSPAARAALKLQDDILSTLNAQSQNVDLPYENAVNTRNLGPWGFLPLRGPTAPRLDPDQHVRVDSVAKHGSLGAIISRRLYPTPALRSPRASGTQRALKRSRRRRSGLCANMTPFWHPTISVKRPLRVPRRLARVRARPPALSPPPPR